MVHHALVDPDLAVLEALIELINQVLVGVS